MMHSAVMVELDKSGPRSGSGDSLAELVDSARAGDHAAFGHLYEQFAPVIHGILLAHVDRGDAEDLVQEVFLTALRRLSSLRQPAAFPGWLARIARNRAYDHHRSARRARKALVMLPTEEDPPPQQEPLADPAAVLAAIRGLPRAYRETLMLRLVEGLTGPEIAKRTGLTPGSVRVNLHRGMKRLKQELGGSSK